MKELIEYDTKELVDINDVVEDKKYLQVADFVFKKYFKDDLIFTIHHYCIIFYINDYNFPIFEINTFPMKPIELIKSIYSFEKKLVNY